MKNTLNQNNLALYQNPVIVRKSCSDLFQLLSRNLCFSYYPLQISLSYAIDVIYTCHLTLQRREDYPRLLFSCRNTVTITGVNL